MAWLRVVRTASIHAILLDSHIFILQKQEEGRWGLGGEGKRARP